MFTRPALAVPALLALVLNVIALAGPIDPPPGPVASTGKLLSDVEPRIAINAQNTPGTPLSLFRITQSGSYYLTGNVLGAAGKHGIEINAAGVTLDLNGFTVQGAAGSLDGISMPNFYDTVVVRNGQVRGWTGSGVKVRIDSGRIESITATECGGWGIENHVGAFATHMVMCEARANGAGGIRGSNDARIAECVSGDNGGAGIAAGTDSMITACLSNRNIVGIQAGARSTIAQCTIHATSGAGILAQGLSTIRHNSVVGTDGDGIRVFGSTSHIEGNLVVENTSAGIRIDAAGNFVVKNTARSNTAGNYLITGTQTIGPIITTTGTIADSVSPWANFSF